MGLFYILIMVVVTGFCVFFRTCITIHLKEYVSPYVNYSLIKEKWKKWWKKSRVPSVVSLELWERCLAWSGFSSGQGQRDLSGACRFPMGLLPSDPCVTCTFLAVIGGRAASGNCGPVRLHLACFRDLADAKVRGSGWVWPTIVSPQGPGGYELIWFHFTWREWGGQMIASQCSSLSCMPEGFSLVSSWHRERILTWWISLGCDRGCQLMASVNVCCIWTK